MPNVVRHLEMQRKRLTFLPAGLPAAAKRSLGQEGRHVGNTVFFVVHGLRESPKTLILSPVKMKIFLPECFINDKENE